MGNFKCKDCHCNCHCDGNLHNHHYDGDPCTCEDCHCSKNDKLEQAGNLTYENEVKKSFTKE
tara:strand:- start:934 stop:1119 length:186 start_codon:yes stop_codon:yes gene_type:complete